MSSSGSSAGRGEEREEDGGGYGLDALPTFHQPELSLRTHLTGGRLGTQASRMPPPSVLARVGLVSFQSLLKCGLTLSTQS